MLIERTEGCFVGKIIVSFSLISAEVPQTSEDVP